VGSRQSEVKRQNAKGKSEKPAGFNVCTLPFDFALPTAHSHFLLPIGVERQIA
jgi:hypothetical protein